MQIISRHQGKETINQKPFEHRTLRGRTSCASRYTQHMHTQTYAHTNAHIQMHAHCIHKQHIIVKTQKQRKPNTSCRRCDLPKPSVKHRHRWSIKNINENLKPILRTLTPLGTASTQANQNPVTEACEQHSTLTRQNWTAWEALSSPPISGEYSREWKPMQALKMLSVRSHCYSVQY